MQYTLYATLLQGANNNDALITYFEKLQTTEWQNKRSEIISRGKHVCQHFSKGKTITRHIKNGKEYYFVTILHNARLYHNYFLNNGEPDFFYIYDKRDIIFTPTPRHSYLHVHHTYYNLDLQPQEYDAESLTTLRNHCHYHLHETTQIPVQRRMETGEYEKLFLSSCSHCHGAGVLPQFNYYEWNLLQLLGC